MSKTTEKAAKKISDNIEEAYRLIKEAEALADKHKLFFSFSVAYGMGGDYHGDTADRYSDWDDNPGGWSPSSQSC